MIYMHGCTWLINHTRTVKMLHSPAHKQIQKVTRQRRGLLPHDSTRDSKCMSHVSWKTRHARLGTYVYTVSLQLPHHHHDIILLAAAEVEWCSRSRVVVAAAGRRQGIPHRVELRKITTSQDVGKWVASRHHNERASHHVNTTSHVGKWVASRHHNERASHHVNTTSHDVGKWVASRHHNEKSLTPCKHNFS